VLLWLLWSGGVEVAEPCDDVAEVDEVWSLLVAAAWPFWLLLDPVASALGLLTCADAPPAPTLPEAEPMLPLMLPEACWLVQVSETLLIELTWKEPSLAWVPWTCTSRPSLGCNCELSPVRLTVWPLPPD
jgi:hypothetical protein